MNYKFLIIIFLLPFNSHCQEFEVRGNVFNELKLGAEGIQIENKRTKVICYSKCNGSYAIVAMLGDTLHFTGEYFKSGTQIVANHQRMSVILNLDYENIRQTFNHVMDQRYDNPTEEKKKIYLKGRSEVTMVVDYKFDRGTPLSISELNPENIDTIIPLRSNFARDLLGEWGGNGAVWIYTKCQNK